MPVTTELAQPAWLDPSSGHLRADGRLTLYGPLPDAQLPRFIARIKETPEVASLEFPGTYLTTEQLRPLEALALPLHPREVALRTLAPLEALYPRIESLRVESEATEHVGMLTRLSSLRDLAFFLSGATDETLRVCAHMPELERLELRSVPVRGPGIAHLAAPEKLRALEIQELVGSSAIDKAATELTAKELAPIARCTGLRHFSIGVQKVAPDALGFLSALDALETLTVMSLAAKKLDVRGIASAARALRALSWGQSELPLAVAEGLARGARFEALRCYGRCKLARGVLAELATIPTLSVAGLASTTGATDADLAAFAGHGALRELALGGEELTDAAIAHLARIPSLTDLTLRKTAVTDAGVAALVALPVARLSLEHTPVTDACIPALVAAKGLTSVGLGKTKVSKKGVAELKKKRPDLDVSLYAL